jgi:hypothetical protein
MGKVLFALGTWRRQLRNFGLRRHLAGLGSARGSRAGFGGAPKRSFLELRSSSVPMHLEKFAIANFFKCRGCNGCEATAKLSKPGRRGDRYHDSGRYTPKIDKSA